MLELKNDLAGVVSWEGPYLWNQTFFSQYVRPTRTHVRHTHTLEPDPAFPYNKKDKKKGVIKFVKFGYCKIQKKVYNS